VNNVYFTTDKKSEMKKNSMKFLYDIEIHREELKIAVPPHRFVQKKLNEK